MTSLVDALREHLAKDPDIQGTDKHTRDQILDSMALSRFRQSSNNDKALSMALDVDDTLEKLQDFITKAPKEKYSSKYTHVVERREHGKGKHTPFTRHESKALAEKAAKETYEGDQGDHVYKVVNAKNAVNQKFDKLAKDNPEEHNDNGPINKRTAQEDAVQERNTATEQAAKERWEDDEINQDADYRATDKAARDAEKARLARERARTPEQVEASKKVDAGIQQQRGQQEAEGLADAAAQAQTSSDSTETDAGAKAKIEGMISVLPEALKATYQNRLNQGLASGMSHSAILENNYLTQGGEAEEGQTPALGADTGEEQADEEQPAGQGHQWSAGAQGLADQYTHADDSELTAESHGDGTHAELSAGPKNDGTPKAIAMSKLRDHIAANPDNYKLKDEGVSSEEASGEAGDEGPTSQFTDNAHEGWHEDQSLDLLSGLSDHAQTHVESKLSDIRSKNQFTGEQGSQEHRAFDMNNLGQALASAHDNPVGINEENEEEEISEDDKGKLRTKMDEINSHPDWDKIRHSAPKYEGRPLPISPGEDADGETPEAGPESTPSDNATDVGQGGTSPEVSPGEVSNIAESDSEAEKEPEAEETTEQPEANDGTQAEPEAKKGDEETEVKPDATTNTGAGESQASASSETSAGKVGDPPVPDAAAAEAAQNAELRATHIDELKTVLDPKLHAHLDQPGKFSDGEIKSMWTKHFWNPSIEGSANSGEDKEAIRTQKIDQLLGEGEFGPKPGEEDSHVKPLKNTSRDTLRHMSHSDLDKFHAETMRTHIRSEEAKVTEAETSAKAHEDAIRSHEINSKTFPNLDQMHADGADITEEQATDLGRQLHAHYIDVQNSGDFAKLHPKTLDRMSDAMDQAARHGANYDTLQSELEEHGQNFGGADHMAQVESASARNRTEDANYDKAVSHGPGVVKAFSDTNNRPNSFVTHNEEGAISHVTTDGKEHGISSGEHPHGPDVRGSQPVHLNDLDPQSKDILESLHEDHHALQTHGPSMKAGDVGPDGETRTRPLTESIAEKTKHLEDRGVNPEHLGADTTSAATRLNRINSMIPDTPSATPDATSYHPHSGYHINTDVHAKMVKGLKNGESIHVPNPEAHHVDGVALGQSTGASSSGGVLISKHGIHPVAAHDPTKHNTADRHGPLSSRDVIAGHLGKEMHQLHQDSPESSMSTSMHIEANHPATSAVHNTDHPSVTPPSTTPKTSGKGGGSALGRIKAKLGYGTGGQTAYGAARDLGSSTKRFAANRARGTVDRVATSVSDKAANPPKSMTEKLHGYLQNKVPGYKPHPDMSMKQAIHGAIKAHGDNLKAGRAMNRTASAPPPRPGAARTSAPPPPSTAGAASTAKPQTPKTPKPKATKVKTPKVKTEAPKTTPTPTGPTDAQQTAATTAASTPTPGTPAMFGGSQVAVEKMLTFMKSITYAGEQFSGYNKPKRTSDHKTKSHAVAAKEGDTIKLIRFGQQGVSGEGKASKSDSKADKARRKSFKARHAKNIDRGKMSAAYWADKEKW